MSFYRYGKLRSREDVTQLDRGRVRQTRLLLSEAVSSAQEETPVENLLTVVSRETSREPTAGQQHWGGRQMTGDPSSASSLEDSPEAQLTCPSSAKALLPYHCHKQGLLPPSSPLIFIFFSMAAQLQMQALCSYMLCPQHPRPRAQRGLCAHRWRRADGGCADWVAEMSPRRKWVRGHTRQWPTRREVVQAAVGPGPGGHPRRQDIATLDLEQAWLLVSSHTWLDSQSSSPSPPHKEGHSREQSKGRGLLLKA